MQAIEFETPVAGNRTLLSRFARRYVLFAAISLSLLGVVGLVLYMLALDALRDSSHARIRLNLISIADRIEAFVVPVSVHAVAAKMALADLVRAEPAAARVVDVRDGGVPGVVAGDAADGFPLDGVLVLGQRDNRDIGFAKAILERLRIAGQGIPHQVRWYCLSESGLLVGYPAVAPAKLAKNLGLSDPASAFADVCAHFAWDPTLFITNTGADRYWTPVFKDRVTGQESAALVQPIYDTKSRVWGCLVAVVPIDLMPLPNPVSRKESVCLEGWRKSAFCIASSEAACHSEVAAHGKWIKDGARVNVGNTGLSLVARMQDPMVEGWGRAVAVGLVLLWAMAAGTFAWVGALVRRELMVPAEMLLATAKAVVTREGREAGDQGDYKSLFASISNRFHQSHNAALLAETRAAALEKEFAGLQAFSDRAKFLMEQTRCIMLVLDRDGGIVDCNGAALQFVGIDMEKALGRSGVTLCAAPEGRAMLGAAFAEAMAHGRARAESVPPPVNTLSDKPVSWSLVLWQPEAHVEAQIAMIGENTAFGAGEHPDLIEDREFLHLMIDRLPLAVFAKEAGHDVEFGRFVLWNKRCQDLFGMTPEQVLGKTDLDLYERSYAERSSAKDREVVDGGVPLILREDPILSKTLGSRLLRTIKIPIFSLGGDPKFLLFISEDITARAAVERELERNSEQLKRLIDQAPDAILISAPAGGFIEVNHAACELLGFTKAELLKMRLPDIYAGPSNSLIEALADIREGGVHKKEHLLSRKDGSVVQTEIVARSLKDGRMQAFIRDITGRKKLELELQRSRDKAEAASISKTHILSAMNREAGTPLGHILGFSALLRDSAPDPETREGAAIMAKAATRISALFQEMITLAEDESGEIPLKVEPFDLRDFMDSCVAEHKPDAVEKGLSLELDFYPESPRLLSSDPRRLKQVFDQIVDNAIRYAGSGTIWVEIRSEGGDAAKPVDERALSLTVKDEGPGIPQETLRAVFAPFEEGESDILVHGHTAGFGLALSRRLARRMGGDIKVDSGHGKGTTVEIVIPQYVVQQGGD